jgi:hypothetical protein
VTKLSKPSDLADWAAKRAGNLDRLLAEARRNDADLYKQSMVQLDVLAQLLAGVGDEAGALYISSLARLLEDRARSKRQVPPTNIGWKQATPNVYMKTATHKVELIHTVLAAVPEYLAGDDHAVTEAVLATLAALGITVRSDGSLERPWPSR